MAPIPEYIIDQIRDSVNIVDVVSRFVTLKKRGRNYLGLCPFHQEKTPSFNVNPERQIFHCFGCGVGGNVFTFLMRHENITFVEAVRRLAEETGVKIPVSAEYKKQEGQTEKLLKANQTALNYYYQQLKSAPPPVKEYVEKRGIKPATIEQFQIGYATPAWDGLLKYIQHFKYSVEPYKKLGLILESEKASKRNYDRFRNRLMFPIHNPSGKVVGFGGRDLSGEANVPKYLNSPESPVYRKSGVLYGLYQAKDSIREQSAVLFVEGYMDVIQLAQHGIRNVTATSGTALTEEHARLIRRYTNKVYLCYDSDTAGINAAAKGGAVLFQNSLEVYVLLLPPGEDPDSFVQSKGAEAFRTALGEADDYLTFRLDLLKNRFDMSKALERAQAVNEIIEVLLPMKDSLQLSFYTEKVAEQLKLPATLLLNELKKRKPRQPAYHPPDQSSSSAGVNRNTPDTDMPLTFTGAWGAEKGIVLLLVEYFNDIYDHVFAHLEASDFLNREFRELFTFLQSQKDEPGEHLFHRVLEHIESEELKALLVKETNHINPIFQKPALYLQGCIKQMKIARYQAQLELLRRKIQEVAPGTEEYHTLLGEMQNAMVQLKNWQDVVYEEE